MIVGGQSSEKYEDKAYAFSLSPSVDVPSCLESICDFPNYVRPSSAAVFDDGLPTVCGGVDTNSMYNQCFKFNFTNAWEYSGSKHVKRHGVGGKHFKTFLWNKVYRMNLKAYSQYRCQG